MATYKSSRGFELGTALIQWTLQLAVRAGLEELEAWKSDLLTARSRCRKGLLGGLRNSVFERRTSTGSGLFASLGSGLVETLG